MARGFKDELYNIFRGKLYSRRHQEYRKGGKARQNLRFQSFGGKLSERQQSAVLDELTSLFCRDKPKYLQYVLDVLLPESVLRIHRMMGLACLTENHT